MARARLPPASGDAGQSRPQGGDGAMVEIDFSRKDSLVLRMGETKTSRQLARSARCIRARRIVSDDGTVEFELHFRRRHQDWLFAALGV